MKSDKDIIGQKAFGFAKRIVKLSQFLNGEKKEFVMSRQILKSGTSIGANIREAKGAISKAEFSAKLSIAYKESLETDYWLELLFETQYIDKNLYESLQSDCSELSKMLYASLKTSRPSTK